MRDERADDLARREIQTESAEFLAAPPISTLKLRLDEIDPLDCESVLEAVRPLAQDTDWLTRRVETWIDRIARDSNFLPPLLGVNDFGRDFADSGLTLFVHPLLEVFLGSMSPRARGANSERTDVIFTGRSSVFRIMGAGSAIIQWWRCTPLDDKADITRSVAIEAAEEQTIDASTPPIEFNGADSAFEIRDIEGSLSLLRFNLRNGPCPISLRYSPANGAIAAVAPNMRDDSRMILDSAVLRLIGRQDRVEALKTQLSHPSFFVRWQLMREYISARGLAALPELEAFIAREDNPSVKRSALATREMLAAKAKQSEILHADQH